jgi:hypothetical protein
MTTAATSRTMAAAKPSDSQLRVSFSAEGINPGPMLTSEILHPYTKKFPLFPVFEQ